MSKTPKLDPRFCPDGITPTCCASVQDRYESDVSRRCKAAAQKGSLYCVTHQRLRERVDWKRRPFVITLNYKPPRRNEDGSYRKTIIGKTFAHKEDAERYLKLIWGSLESKRKYERFSSACVETIK